MPKPAAPPVAPVIPVETKPDPVPPPKAPVEVPAESRVPAKPDIAPVAPKPPEKPAEPAKAAEPPKAPEVPKPDTPKPDAPKADLPKPDETKPDAPKPDAPKPDQPKPKDDPFGVAGKDVNTMRTWSDASGKYQIEARFVSFEDGTIRLQKTNGRFVRIAYDLLGSADQSYVLKLDQSLLAAE
jgi:hypothetical protein